MEKHHQMGEKLLDQGGQRVGACKFRFCGDHKGLRSGLAMLGPGSVCSTVCTLGVSQWLLTAQNPPLPYN